MKRLLNLGASPDVDYPLFSWVAPNISGFVRGREGYLEELIVREKLRGGNTDDDDDNQREGGLQGSASLNIPIVFCGSAPA